MTSPPARYVTPDHDIAYHGTGVLAYCKWQEDRQRPKARWTVYNRDSGRYSNVTFWPADPKADAVVEAMIQRRLNRVPRGTSPLLPNDPLGYWVDPRN